MRKEIINQIERTVVEPMMEKSKKVIRGNKKKKIFLLSKEEKMLTT